MVDFMHVETEFNLEMSSENTIKIKVLIILFLMRFTFQVLGHKEKDMLYFTNLLIAKITQRQW